MGDGPKEFEVTVPGTRLSEPPDMPPYVILGNLGEYWKRKNRGRGGTLTTVGQTQTVIEVVGDDQLATQMTITCGLDPVAGSLAEDSGNFPPVVGVLRWGNDGYQSEAEIDFVNGAQITAAGSFFSFVARLDADAPNLGNPIPAVQVGAHIGYNTPATRRAQRTRYFSLDVFPDQVLIPVPPFAESLTVLGDGLGGLAVELLDRSLSTMSTVSTIEPRTQPIPNDCRIVRVVNLALGAIDGRVVFGLWL